MTEKQAYAAFLRWRWPDGQPHCPHCGSGKFYDLAARRRFKCAERGCRKQYSATTGTRFASRKMAFADVMRMIVTAPDSALSLQRLLGCQYKTAYVAEQKRKADDPKLWVGYWQPERRRA